MSLTSVLGLLTLQILPSPRTHSVLSLPWEKEQCGLASVLLVFGPLALVLAGERFYWVSATIPPTGSSCTVLIADTHGAFPSGPSQLLGCPGRPIREWSIGNDPSLTYFRSVPCVVSGDG